MAGNKNSGGHNAKGSQFHVLSGTFRADRHAGHESPDPPKGIPEPPKKLTGEARAEWDRMVARLQEAKTISIVDDAALYQYVRLFAEVETIQVDHLALRKLTETLKRAIRKLNGSELVAAVGEIVKLQQILAKHTVQLRQGHMAVRQYLVEFGMTPSARGRVKVPKGKVDDDKSKNKDRFFGHGRA